MTSRTRIAALATVTVAALTLAACGNEPEPEPTPTQESSPLEALLRDYLGDWSNEDVTRQLVAMEDLVATCMAEQGFDYTPVDYAAMGLDLTGETLGLEWGSKEFAQQYGYGITNNPVLGEDAETPEDPNAEYVAGMTPTEQEAYYTALYGVHYAEISDPQAVAEAGWDWRDLGCTGSTQNEAVRGAAALQEQLDEITQREIDTAVADAQCREDVGYDDARRAIDTEYQVQFLAEHRTEVQDWLESLNARRTQD